LQSENENNPGFFGYKPNWISKAANILGASFFFHKIRKESAESLYTKDGFGSNGIFFFPKIIN
jgi:hypothetical protein